MSKMSLTQLVGAMQGKSLTYGWDAVTLYDQRKANELLFQLYVERFNTEDGYIEPASMVASWGDGSYKEHIYNLKLSAPRLSFESSDPSLAARARLTMDMIGGMIVSTKAHTGGARYVSKMLQVLPIGGPQLWMDQPVTKGVVTGLGDVVIDLKNADNFMANFVIGSLAQEEVGRRFQEYFDNLPPRLKIFPLGRLEGELNGVLTPKNFEIKTMKSDPLALFGDERYGDGAVMMFITLKDGQDGKTFPNENSPYLIPADGNGAKYTGAMLLSSRVLFDKVMRGPAKADIGFGIDFLDYTPENGGGQDVAWNLRGSTGGLEHKFVHDYRIRSDDFPATFEADLYSHFKLDDGGPALTIKSSGTRIEFVWNKTYSTRFSRVIHWSWPTGDEWDYGDLSFVCNYSVNFDIALNKDTGVVSFNRNTSSSNFKMEVTGFDHLFDLKWEGINMIPKIEEFFRPKLLEILKELSTPAIDTFLLRNLLFPGHNALHLTEAFVPGDLAVFGEIDPLRTTTVMAPLNSTIEANSTLQFSLTPMPDNVQWSVRDVDGENTTPGVINSSGRYTAPSQAQLPNGFVAVMVTATGTLNGNPVQSSALVSVLHSAMQVNPLYASCDTGQTLDLEAKTLGNTALQWTILTPQWGSTLTAVPGEPDKRKYTAGNNMDPAVPFPIDKIEIKNTANDTVSYIYVSINKVLTVVPMVLHESSDPATGTVRFNLIGEDGPIVPVPGVITLTWNLLAGEGSIDADGVYTEPRTVTPGSFAVISGTANISGVVKIHGHTAIPLPLGKYAELIETVNQTIRGI